MTLSNRKNLSLSLDSSLVRDDQPVEVMDNLFIGSLHAAYNSEALKRHGITHILNISRVPGGADVKSLSDCTYLSIDLRDRDDAPLLSLLPLSNSFISSAIITGGGVLVHCFHGKSRSVSLILAYIMSSIRIGFKEAYDIVRSVRPVASINLGFECQLRAYETAKYDIHLAQQLVLHARIRDISAIRMEEFEALKKDNDDTGNHVDEDSHDVPPNFYSSPPHSNSNPPVSPTPPPLNLSKNISFRQSSFNDPNLYSHDPPPINEPIKRFNSFKRISSMNLSRTVSQRNMFNDSANSSSKENSTASSSLLSTSSNSPALSPPTPSSTLTKLKSFNKRNNLFFNSEMTDSVEEGPVIATGDDAIEVVSTWQNNNITSNITNKFERPPLAPVNSIRSRGSSSTSPTHSISDPSINITSLNERAKTELMLSDDEEQTSKTLPPLVRTPLLNYSSPSSDISNSTPSSSNNSNNSSQVNINSSTPVKTLLKDQKTLKNVEVPIIKFSPKSSTSFFSIPPLQGHLRVYCCAWCDTALFQGRNILKPSKDILMYISNQFSEEFAHTDRKIFNESNSMKYDFESTAINYKDQSNYDNILSHLIDSFQRNLQDCGNTSFVKTLHKDYVENVTREEGEEEVYVNSARASEMRLSNELDFSEIDHERPYISEDEDEEISNTLKTNNLSSRALPLIPNSSLPPLARNANMNSKPTCFSNNDNDNDGFSSSSYTSGLPSTYHPPPMSTRASSLRGGGSFNFDMDPPSSKVQPLPRILNSSPPPLISSSSKSNIFEMNNSPSTSFAFDDFQLIPLPPTSHLKNIHSIISNLFDTYDLPPYLLPLPNINSVERQTHYKTWKTFIFFLLHPSLLDEARKNILSLNPIHPLIDLVNCYYDKSNENKFILDEYRLDILNKLITKDSILDECYRSNDEEVDNTNMIFIEYLHWMGRDILDLLYQDQGKIICPNCNHWLGSWTISPSHTGNVLSNNIYLEKPIFALHRSLVYPTNYTEPTMSYDIDYS